MQKTQVIIIGGGEAWDTKEEYLAYLKNYEFTQEKFDKMVVRRWKDHLQKDVGTQYAVIRPHMPNPLDAKYAEWAIWFEKMIPWMRDGVIFVGHSLGANFLAKYLSENTLPISVAQVHLVAGCFGCAGGFDLPESLAQIQKTCKTIILYHAHDDEVVDFADAQKYQKALPDAKLIAFTDRGHFRQEHFPELVAEITQHNKNDMC